MLEKVILDNPLLRNVRVGSSLRVVEKMNDGRVVLEVSVEDVVDVEDKSALKKNKIDKMREKLELPLLSDGFEPLTREEANER